MIRSEEEPIPRTKRPSEASASAAASWASSAGPRWKTPTMPVPRRIRSVHAALRASGVKPSGPAVSPLQRSVYPAASARLTYSPCCASGTPVSGSVRPQRPSTRRPYRVRAPMPAPTPAKPDRNLALELVRVTEAAALAAARWVGRGDKLAADGAAVDAMRFVLDSVSMDGIVVIGEGEKDEAPMLFNGESIGDGSPPQVDIAVDPLEGTRLCALGMPSALAVIALAERGSMFDPGPCVYMEKLAGGVDIADLLDLDRPLVETCKLVAERRGGSIGDVIVVVLDRPRHEEQIREIREAGARIRLITDGDVSAALLAVSERSPVDLLWGIGGTPEGVLSAAALKSMGGQLLGRLWPRNDEERSAAVDAGYDLDRILTANDLCSGDDVFFSATGVTDGDVLQGVRYRGKGATTESLVMRSRSGTVRRVQATHDRSKLREIVGTETYG